MLTTSSLVASLSAASDLNDGMNQLGVRLRQARMCQEISLMEAAAATRILPCYLLALESGAYVALPGDVCIRGFIRNYAQYLGIPVEELIDLYQCEYGSPKPIRIEPAIGGPQLRKRWLPSFLGASCIVLLLVGASYLVLSALS